MPALCTQIANILASGPLVLASIITSSGSAPRTSGARMLVRPDGSIAGTIGGGRYEAETIKEALSLMQNGKTAACIFFSLNQAGDMDMICGGAILVLLEHIAPTPENKRLFAQAAEAESADQSFAFAARLDFPQADLFNPGQDSPIEHGSVTRHFLPRGAEPSKELPAAIYPALDESWNKDAPFIRKIHGQAWLFESFLPPERIHIIGAGHVSLALARLAEHSGFSASVLDDRSEFVNAARFPHSRLVQPPSLAEKHMDEYFAASKPGARDAVVIVTRGHAFDRDALAAALRTGAGYIGMIGSSPKRKQVYASLLQSGFAQSDLDRVFSPIGLSIGAETPEEIAVSIMAELIKWRRGLLTRKQVS